MMNRPENRPERFGIEYAPNQRELARDYRRETVRPMDADGRRINR